jgi:phospholipid transport system transporter-binding protein
MNAISPARSAIAASGPLHLDGDLSISNVEALKRQLDAALSDGAPVLLDGAGIDRIDAAALQLLAAFTREAAHRDLRVSWQSASPRLVAAARAIGLHEAVGLGGLVA